MASDAVLETTVTAMGLDWTGLGWAGLGRQGCCVPTDVTPFKRVHDDNSDADNESDDAGQDSVHLRDGNRLGDTLR